MKMGAAPRTTFDDVAVGQRRAQGQQLAVDLHPDGGVADVGVDSVGEVQRHGSRAAG